MVEERIGPMIIHWILLVHLVSIIVTLLLIKIFSDKDFSHTI